MLGADLMVKVEPVVELPTLSVSETPVGNPETENVTELLKPLAGFTVIASVPLWPGVSDRLAAEIDSVNDGAALTTIT